MSPVGLALIAIAAAVASSASAQTSDSERKKAPPLETYESNSIGITNDSDDVGFLDVKLSLKYPFMPERIARTFPHSRLYFAATTRFAQYLGTRESSPVLGKRFNPKLLWRRWQESASAGKSCSSTEEACEYVDIAFAHESNGQSIDTEQLFRIQQEVGRFPRGRADFARDYISRGWDYIEVAGRHWIQPLGIRLDWAARHFLRKGPLQGRAEEYYDWEDDPEVKPRRRVHGLAVLGNWGRNPRLALGLETGGSRPLRYNTVRVELAMLVSELPLMVFYQNGYGNDLALYYQRASSLGVALEFANF